MDYNIKFKHGDVVETGSPEHPRVLVIFGRLKQWPSEGCIYAAADEKTLIVTIKGHCARLIDNDIVRADMYRARFEAKNKNSLKERDA